jgi:hypothetical protein
MSSAGFYNEAHLAVAAIRILEHQNDAPPSVDAICRCLAFSIEKGTRICRKLDDLKIIEVVDGAFGTRVFIINHPVLEDISQDDTGSGLEDEVKKFKDSRKEFTQEIESFKAKQDQKQKDLFASLEKKLKGDSEDDKGL